MPDLQQDTSPELLASPQGVELVVNEIAKKRREIERIDIFRSRNSNYPDHISRKFGEARSKRYVESRAMLSVLGRILPGVEWQQAIEDKRRPSTYDPDHIIIDGIEWPPKDVDLL